MGRFEKIIREKNEKILIEGHEFEFDRDGFIKFGDVSTILLNTQAQYASRYIGDLDKDYPNLSDGLNFIGDCSNYHDMKIHKDSVLEFIKRFRAYKGE